MAMLRSIKIFKRIAFHSRVAVISSPCQLKFGEILQCDYATHPVKVSLENRLTWVNGRKIDQHTDLKDILNRIQKQKVSKDEALEILKRCGRKEALHAELIDNVWAVLKKMVQLDINHYNALLKIYIDKEKQFDPVEFLEEILSANIEPNRTTFGHLIRAFAVQGDVNGVINILEEMNRKEIPINENTYNNLILAFANDGNVEKMRELENSMESKGLKVQTETLNTLLKGYAKSGSIDDINRTFDRFEKLKIVLLNKDVLDTIFKLYVNGHHELIDTVARRLYKSIEFTASLKSIVEEALKKKADGVVHKLLAIFDETDRITLAKLYVGALRVADAKQTDEAIQLLESYGINLQTQPSVFEAGMQSNSLQLIRAILDDMKAKSIPFECKDFRKLIELEKVNGTNAVLNVVHSMKKDFNVEPDIDTIRDVVLPCLGVAVDPHLALARLRTVEENTFRIVRCVFERCLLNNQMQAAYEVANDYKHYTFHLEYLQKSLIDAYVATGDVQHFVKVINILQLSLANERYFKPNSNEANDSNDFDAIESNDEKIRVSENTSATRQFNAVGNVLRETINRIREQPKQVETLLRAFLQEGLAISPGCARNIKNDPRGGLNENSIKLLNKLCSGKVFPVSLDVEEMRRRPLGLLSSGELQKMIEIKEEQGKDVVALNKILCRAYIKEKNVEKVNEFAKLCKLGYNDHSNIINMHIGMGNIEEALNHRLKIIREINPDYTLLRHQVAQIARNMFNAKHEWNDIIRIFTENKQTQPPNENFVDVRYLLRDVTNTGNAAQLNELCNVLIENNFMIDNNRFAGNMIKVHLVNNDLSEAVRTFEQQLKEKKITSCKVTLMKTLIEANEMEKLESVFDMVLSKHSETDAVLTLAQCFIELGNIRQAQVVLKNSFKRNSDILFRRNCEYYHKIGNHVVLEGLLEATDGLEYDRRVIYYYLLLHYCNEGRAQDALGLWHKQLDRDERPTNKFLQTLASHLNQNGIQVPFKVPKAVQSVEAVTLSKPENVSEPVKVAKGITPKKVIVLSNDESALKNAIENNNIDGALKSWQQIDSASSRYVPLTTALIELLSNSNYNAEAVDIAIQAANSGKCKSSAMRKLTEKLVKAGEIQLLDRLDDLLPPAIKRVVKIGNNIMEAYETSGKWNEFFERYLAKCGAATDETNANRIPKLQRIGLLRLLQKQSIPLNEFEDFANKVADKGVYGPLSVLWAHHFLNDSPESSKLYDRLEQEFSTKFKTAFLAFYLIDKNNVEKLQQLIEFVKTRDPDQLSNIHQEIFHSHIRNERINDALAMIDNGELTVQQIGERLLNELKKRIVASGAKIPDSILHTNEVDKVK